MLAGPVETAYISCSCNISPHAADWGRNNIVAFGSCNATAFYNTDKCSGAGQVESTVYTNRSKINVVHWLRTTDGSGETEGLSGSCDGGLVLWNYVTKQCTNLSGHEMGVTVIDSLYLPSDGERQQTTRTFVTSASADSTVRIWYRMEGAAADSSFTCIQTLNFGHGICLALRLCRLPGTQSLLLACAMDDSSVQLFATDCTNADVQFKKVDTLLGHEDWVRALDFTHHGSGDILLASGSQDSNVRLWRISPCSNRRARKPLSQLDPSEDIEAEERVFTIISTDKHFSITLESVLAGHEGWVYGIAWQTTVPGTPLSLLSCSMDKTMIIWSPDGDTDVWSERVRVGDVGGNSLGFYGCKFSPDGASILGHGYQGAFNMWRYSQTSASWLPRVACGGHFKDVVDVQWEPRGMYFMSAGHDQTTRLHAPWVRHGEVTWHEIARPQVHGFDMSCLAVMSDHRFSSGSEEKLVRCFEAPGSFLSSLSVVTGSTYEAGDRATGATVPSLGLSNKAVHESGDHGAGLPGGRGKQASLSEPPTEDHLLQSTLWPECRKLYGHGYEVYSLAARNDGKRLASACKASTVEHAAVILWDTDTWQEVQRLPSQKLTVTQLAFSPSGLYLLSVSRDRCWSLFLQDPASGLYHLLARTDPKSNIHSRIIWTCCWSHDSRYYSTGSRDGKVAVWEPPEDAAAECEAVLNMNPIAGDSVTALSFAPDKIDAVFYLLCVGFESGLIEAYKWEGKGRQPIKCFRLDQSSGHHLRVQRLSFRPVSGLAGHENAEHFMQLASCGADHAVKVFNIDSRKL